MGRRQQLRILPLRARTRLLIVNCRQNELGTDEMYHRHLLLHTVIKTNRMETKTLQNHQKQCHTVVNVKAQMAGDFAMERRREHMISAFQRRPVEKMICGHPQTYDNR